MEIVQAATIELGALGATISGAGPTVLVWCFWQSTGKVVEALRKRVGDWGEVRRVPFSALGADVPEL
jgi:homoserine kinase